MKSHQRTFFESLREAIKPYGHHVAYNYPIGPFTADVYVHPYWIVEVDGREHRTTAIRKSDASRTLYLESKGKTVMRVTNKEVGHPDSLSDAVSRVMRVIVPPMPTPDYSVIRCHSLHPLA